MKTKLLFIVTLIFAGVVDTRGSSTGDDPHDYPFWNSELPMESRVEDLLSRLTLQEKVSQMYDKSPAIKRLGIPRYEWWNEALHGVARSGKATVFPQAIGLAASFDEALVKKVATAVSIEARAKHADYLSRGTRSMYTGLTFWTPNINIFRDPRWGRGQETYGEDPYLTSRIATAFVLGLEGDNPERPRTIATLKHYAVHSGPEPSRHSDDYRPSEYELRATYLAAFERVIRDTNVNSVMCAYNAVDGVPACANERLMKDILRDEMGFDGYVVSDCGAIADIYKAGAHAFAGGKAEASAMAVKAGVSLECGDGDGSAFADLLSAVDDGLISEAQIDDALRKLIQARMKLGMFDRETAVDWGASPAVVGSDEHLRLALEAARKSIVLLDNDGVLPLEAGTKVALIGPNADNEDVLLANYHGKPVDPRTLRTALVRRASETVFYAPGSALAGDHYTHYETVPADRFSHKNGEQITAGLIVDYFDKPEFSDRPHHSETVENVDLTWQRSPINGADDDEYAVRFRGYLTPKQAGRYRFGDGLKTFIDGQEITDAVRLEAGRSYVFRAEKIVRQYWHSNAIEPSAILEWARLDRDLLAEALTAASKADVIVAAGGISAKLEGEEMPVDIDGFKGGDRTRLDLPQTQLELLERLKETGKPVVYVNFSGSAVNLDWAKQHANAVIQAFYPGEKTGTAISELLYGDFSPSGRLPVTFYRSVDDLPDFSDYGMQGRTHRYFTGDPVYPFGAGKGYVEFKHELLHKPDFVGKEEALIIRLRVTNLGQMAAEEVIQLYVEPEPDQAKELQELKGFTRIRIPPRESAVVDVSVPANELFFRGANGQPVPYRGLVRFRIGPRHTRSKVSRTRFEVLFGNGA